MVELARSRDLHSADIDGDLSVIPSILHDFAEGPFPIDRLCLLNGALTPPSSYGARSSWEHVSERIADYWQGILAMVIHRFEFEATRQCRVIALDHYTRATGMVFRSS